MKQAFSYIRFSSPEQAGGDSFRRQSEAAAAWAERKGYRIVKSWKDLGVSGYRGQNSKAGRFAEFLAGRRERGITEGFGPDHREPGPHVASDAPPGFLHLSASDGSGHRYRHPLERRDLRQGLGGQGSVQALRVAKRYGPWEIVDNIDEGGQATVIRVEDWTGARSGVFALKRLRNAKRIERFKNEVEAVTALKHLNVVPLVDNSAFDAPPSDKDRQYLVMPVAEGGSLDNAVRFKGERRSPGRIR
jgi:hypothetical protein